jgi:hypothetical protein
LKMAWGLHRQPILHPRSGDNILLPSSKNQIFSYTDSNKWQTNGGKVRKLLTTESLHYLPLELDQCLIRHSSTSAALGDQWRVQVESARHTQGTT